MANPQTQTLDQFKKLPSAALSKMKAGGEPWTLTYAGKTQLVVQDAKAYAKMVERMEYLESVAAIKQGVADVQAGRVYTLTQVRKMLKKKYEIAD